MWGRPIFPLCIASGKVRGIQQKLNFTYYTTVLSNVRHQACGMLQWHSASRNAMQHPAVCRLATLLDNVWVNHTKYTYIGGVSYCCILAYLVWNVHNLMHILLTFPIKGYIEWKHCCCTGTGTKFVAYLSLSPMLNDNISLEIWSCVPVRVCSMPDHHA